MGILGSISDDTRHRIVQALPVPVANTARKAIRLVRPVSIVTREPRFVRWFRRVVLRRKPVLYHFEIHITDHCNLNCKGCAHFSNLCKPWFADLAEFETDMRAMADTFSAVRRIYLLGGEPLLHPDVDKFVRLSRQIFPKTRIYLMTNATLVTRMGEEFWRALADSDVVLLCDSYPINLPVEEIDRLGREHGAKVEWTVPRKEFFKIPIDPTGSQDAAASFAACTGLNNCPIMRDGKLYPCAYAAFADVFRERFGIEDGLEVTERDYFDVRVPHDAEDAMRFLLHPIPWCANCDMGHLDWYEWGRSSKTLDEWVNRDTAAAS